MPILRITHDIASARYQVSPELSPLSHPGREVACHVARTGPEVKALSS